MAWKQISECLPAWLSAEIGKGTGADEGPGQVVVREVVPTSSEEQAAPVNLANGKRLDTAVTSRSPSGAVSRRLALVVIEGGGGRPAQGGASRAAYAQARGGNLASNSLRLV